MNGHANPNALYLIGSGGNDDIVAAVTDSPAKANPFLVAEAGALVNSVSELKADGGRYIIVTNEYVAPSADATAIAYGKTLVGETWGGLAAAGVNFVPADTLSVIAAVEQNPLAFGITAPINFERYALRPRVSYAFGLRLSLRTNHDAEFELWVSGVCQCYADAPLHG